MANYCHNSVAFSGPLPSLIRVRLLFSEMQESSHRGLPDFIQSDSGHMTDIGVGENSVSFRTRWVPNLDVIRRIAEHFGLDYTQRYEEPHMLVFGEASWQSGEHRHIYLEHRDLKDMRYDPASEMFLYQGQAYEEDIEIWKIIIEQKKKQLAEKGYLFQTASAISAADLTEIYGELPGGDLFLKLAEHQNFAAAEALFDTWDAETIAVMQDYLNETLRQTAVLEKKHDEYMAHLYLRDLIERYGPQTKPALSPDNRWPKR